MNDLPPLQHRPSSSQANATPSHSATSSPCLAGKKHTSTPPPPIPARSPRRPIFSSSSGTSPAAAAHGIKLFRSNDFDGKSVDHECAAAFDSAERSLNGGNVVQSPLSHQHQPECQEQQQQPPRQVQHRRRCSVLDDIDYEASNVCEYIKDRLYFMWTSINPVSTRRTTYLTIDNYLQYKAFFSDFGPFDIADIFRFCCLLRERLELARLQGKMLLHHQTPEQACRPINDIHPPFTPYRDAGFGPSTFSLSILDCLQGLRKGLDLGLLRLDQFDVKEYEHYESVSNGDFNWITPCFIAFAGPTDKMTLEDLQAAITQRALRHPHGTPSESDATSSCGSTSGSTPSPSNTSSRSATPSSIHSSKPCSKVPTPNPQAIPEDNPPSSKNSSPASETLAPPLATILQNSTWEKGSDSASSSTTTSQKIKKRRSRLSKSFQSLLDYFEKGNVKTVIRLNDKTYDAAHFTVRDIEHQDMIYPDGTCPPWFIVRHFLAICEDVIDKGGVVAVHCKAGLGRTGTLIAVYLMKTYGMTAREVIAYLRLMRPGSVVGPQQNWLEENESRILSWYDGTSSNMISPVGAPASSPAIGATPATGYEQVFSRANSSGLDSTWSEAENSDDDDEDEDEDVDARRKFDLADLISHQGNASGPESLMAMDMDVGGSTEDESGGPMWIEDTLDDHAKPSPVQVMPGPSPVRVLGYTRNLSESLASVTDGIMDEIELEKEQKSMAETVLDADMDTSPHQEHIGNKDYTIPIQPRKHTHHTHHSHHETTAMSSATVSTLNSSLSTPSSLKDDGEDCISGSREPFLQTEPALFPSKSVEMSDTLDHDLQENGDHTLEQLNMLRRQRQHPHVELHNREPAR
ncbi:Dual specificity protein phosphatase cdc14a [Mortierella antarctica]|nr:Dual specificity protein phosphatase cdc14a [Mortierella antarctica]